MWELDYRLNPWDTSLVKRREKERTRAPPKGCIPYFLLLPSSYCPIPALLLEILKYWLQLPKTYTGPLPKSLFYDSPPFANMLSGCTALRLSIHSLWNLFWQHHQIKFYSLQIFWFSLTSTIHSPNSAKDLYFSVHFSTCLNLKNAKYLYNN